VYVANDNGPGQLVVGGDRARVLELREEATRLGLKTMLLRVHGAFHTPAMQEAADAFAEVVAEVEFAPPRMPVISGATARPFVDPPRELAAAIARPVRWREVLDALAELGIGRYIEVGPGAVLRRLANRALPGVEAVGWQHMVPSPGV
jgi:malonyl CoA-acyl carrier protein transacylase